MSLLKKTTILTLLFLVFTVEICFASVPYNTYNYDDQTQPVPITAGFVPEDILVASDIGATNLKGPRDMMFDTSGQLFIVDTGNNRIIKLDTNLKVKTVIDGFDNNGTREGFNGPEGIFITKDDEMYIADTQNGRVVKLDKDGNLLGIFGKPEITGIKTKIQYKPEKIAVDEAGRVYVVSKGENNGLIQLDQNGNFTRFHGANKVPVDFRELFLRKFQTAAQRAKGVKFVPTEYSNVMVDSQGFLYTTTRNVRRDAVKRLNAKGDNIIKHEGRTRNEYGDFVWTGSNPQFMDVAVDEANNAFALDAASGKVFTYNAFGDLLFVFGTVRGENVGTLKTPMAIEYRNGKIYIIDESLNLLTIYKVTDFGKLVLDANKYYIDGKYDESLKPWKEVLRYNSNYDLAYVGIGKALMKEENYKEAMKYFKLSYSRENYSKAFKEYRTQLLRDNFSLLMTSIFLLIILVSFIKKYLRRRGFSFNKLIDSY